jgi:hypothetical protein
MARRKFTKKREDGRPGRRSIKNKRLSRPSLHGEAEHGNLPARAGAALVDEILAFLYGQAGEVDLKEIVDSVILTRGQRKEIESLLDDLCHHRLVQKSAKKTYRLHRES